MPSARILLLAILTAILSFAPASAATDELRVATKQTPPFAMLNAEGEWEGLSVELVRSIAEKEGRKAVFVPMGLEEMLRAVSDGKVDMAAAALTMTAEREMMLDFSHPYFRSGLAIAVRDTREGWDRAIQRLFSPAFLRVLGGLSLLLLLSGLLVWFFERRKNPEHFGGTPAEGIGSGFWWAAVTMTTVGYGDKAPKTAPGRLVGLVWMFMSLIVVSGFTAAITTTLTVGSLGGGIEKVDDLYGKRVGTIRASTSSSFLEELSIRGEYFQTVGEALQALERGKIDAVVYDEPVLRYLITTGAAHGVRVVDRSFRTSYYALALPPGSPETEQVNRDLLEVVGSDAWKEIRFRYLHDE
ncbi:transporter substrate-binding domain-containing protein [Chlorobium sp. N1]|uniref:transporter substrate-binding domain-containing protein n=1 Tax=Chlorobium sp. N1 TaxID=2491138 RepID=UPI00103A8BFF|nr:transporter substrate-binding domain-containing protein [Chlorobium sp. N1]TCD46961.1 transporter substrate-binding domain-containing protein [Chlorobium sp. N1]